MIIAKQRLFGVAISVGLALASIVTITKVAMADELASAYVEPKTPKPLAQLIRGTGVAPTPAAPKLLSQAESNYQAGRYVQAIEQFGMVVSVNIACSLQPYLELFKKYSNIKQ